MRENFLTIPDFPNYEINSALVVRNKKTGYLLKPIYRYNKKYYLLCKNGKNSYCSAKNLRAQALAAVSTNIWVPVPSLDFKYEFCQAAGGKLRNAKTKQLIQEIRKGHFHSTINNHKLYVSVTKLRWELFGILPPATSSFPRQCILSKNRQRFFFDSFSAAARFLADKFSYSVRHYRTFFTKREPVICGWRVNYLDEQTPLHNP